MSIGSTASWVCGSDHLNDKSYSTRNPILNVHVYVRNLNGDTGKVMRWGMMGVWG